MFALLCKQHETVRLLLEKGANPNHNMKIPTSLSHETPLDVVMWVANRSTRALIAQDLSVIELLLEHGAFLDNSSAKALMKLRKRAAITP
jgi:ankyrin repeat protein